MRLGPHTITIVAAADKQPDYGTRTELDWSNTTRTEITGCSVQPQPGPEFTLDRDSVTTHWTVYAPPVMRVDPRARVEWDGDTYEIDGDVLRWEFGAMSHLVFTLHKSEG